MGQVMSDSLFSESIKRAAELWIATGDDKHFTVIYSKMYKGLLMHVHKYIKDEDISMDIVADTFFSIIKNKWQYDPKRAQFVTWAYNIAKNLALAHLKSEKRLDETRQNSPQHIYDVVGTTALEYQSEDIDTKGQYIYSKEKYDDDDEKTLILLHQRAIQEIMNLNDTYREFLYDREIRKLTYEEIAKKHGIKMNTIKSKIRLGREIIKVRLIEYAHTVGINPESLSRLFSHE